MIVKLPIFHEKICHDLNEWNVSQARDNRQFISAVF